MTLMKRYSSQFIRSNWLYTSGNAYWRTSHGPISTVVIDVKQNLAIYQGIIWYGQTQFTPGMQEWCNIRKSIYSANKLKGKDSTNKWTLISVKN